ncbi:MAG: hypothetical protein ACHQ4G_12230, partial [Opitutales bacterium]
MNTSGAVFDPAPGYARVKVVGSFHELVTTRFDGGVNALCWPRQLPGDFDEVATQLGPLTEITPIDEDCLLSLRLSPVGAAARDILREDQRRLREAGLDPSLDAVPPLPCDPNAGPVSLDVQTFHVDSATAATDTWLCSYNEAASLGLRNDEARREVDIPAIRAQLLRLYGGADDAGFAAYLHERFFDLHYDPVPAARPFSFGLGN